MRTVYILDQNNELSLADLVLSVRGAALLSEL